MTVTHNLIVVDTNILISAGIFPGSIPYRALLRAFEEGEVLSSPATLTEAREVMAREKFDRYVPYDLRMLRPETIPDQMKKGDPVPCNSECRDAKDEKFLDLAVGANASLILSGDVHLLEMHPFRGISILSPFEYVAQKKQGS